MYIKPMRTHHGLHKHSAYQPWVDMIHRCYTPTRRSFKHYGAKGITVCDEWRNSPVEFVKWADSLGMREGQWLDRINNSKGYSPDNCRWVTILQSNRNKSTTLTVDIVAKIKDLLWLGIESKRIQGAYGIRQQCVSKINTGETWADVKPWSESVHV